MKNLVFTGRQAVVTSYFLGLGVGVFISTDLLGLGVGVFKSIDFLGLGVGVFKSIDFLGLGVGVFILKSCVAMDTGAVKAIMIATAASAMINCLVPIIPFTDNLKDRF
jgi:hypothetical protein